MSLRNVLITTVVLIQIVKVTLLRLRSTSLLSSTYRLHSTKSSSDFEADHHFSEYIASERFHHIEFYCLDALTTSKRFQCGLGLELSAKSDQSTGNHRFASYALQVLSSNAFHLPTYEYSSLVMFGWYSRLHMARIRQPIQVKDSSIVFHLNENSRLNSASNTAWPCEPSPSKFKTLRKHTNTSFAPIHAADHCLLGMFVLSEDPSTSPKFRSTETSC